MTLPAGYTKRFVCEHDCLAYFGLIDSSSEQMDVYWDMLSLGRPRPPTNELCDPNFKCVVPGLAVANPRLSGLLFAWLSFLPFHFQ